MEKWEPVIGLEIHCELNTRSKLFSSAPNRFGDEPNTNISVVCTGQPGSLPILNKEAVHKAVLLGCALNSQISHYSRFDRKSYFYPDSPRNFQITQFESPILMGGMVTTDIDGVMHSFEIDRAHLEDDAGMLKHFNTFTGVDYNRAGVPLIEIVSKPTLFSSKQAVAYAMAIRSILDYLEISDCNMQEGSLRMDANISVRRKGETTLRPKVEIKNMNSFHFMAMALEAEFERQVRFYMTHPHEVMTSATYRWDPDRKETVLMRKKESAEDYRYFPEPDLPPLILEQEYIDAVRATLPELPYARTQRYIDTLALPRDLTTILIHEKRMADYFELALNAYPHQPKITATWLIVEFGGRYKDLPTSVWNEGGIPPSHIGALVELIDRGIITGKIAKEVADVMMRHPNKHPKTIVEENPLFLPLSDEQELRIVIQQVLLENEPSVIDYKKGKERAFGFLIGQIMKATQGKAPPSLANTILKEFINKLSD